MVCDICKKNEAAIRFAEIRGGALRVRDICNACAKSTGITDQLERTVASLLGETAGDAMASLLWVDAGTIACPGCGMTIEEYRRHGQLGCEQCYQAFAAVLRPLLERINGPGRPGSSDRRRALAQRLREAVASEEYELAARLRDELKVLETAAAAGTGHGQQTINGGHDA